MAAVVRPDCLTIRRISKSWSNDNVENGGGRGMSFARIVGEVGVENEIHQNLCLRAVVGSLDWWTVASRCRHGVVASGGVEELVTESNGASSSFHRLCLPRFLHTKLLVRFVCLLQYLESPDVDVIGGSD